MAVVRIDSLPPSGPERERACCRSLEQGNVLFFPETPFEISHADREFLLERRQADAGYHKNIAYRPGSDRVTGVARQHPEDARRLRDVLGRYSRTVVEFTGGLLPSYGGRWKIDYASFRPQEEAGRRLSLHSRNDLLHVDAFPTRPTRGDRIFRVFTNVNPSDPRLWRTGETFEELADRFAVSSGILGRAAHASFGRKLLGAARAMGIPLRARPPYDEFMLRFHHFLKENEAYQESARSEQIAFPPNASWMVFTDAVTHSVLSGQFALEQTFIVSRESLEVPEKAPIAVLERLAGHAMA
ncbi:MAG: Kdo hydroxylase family protein [Acidobacteriota bacterium]